MDDAATLLALSGTAFAAAGLTSFALLRAWNGWLELKRLELGGDPARPARGRAELTRLRERVRRLEAIANGAEL
jgi:hypothetical protein